jgi:hypothetical protein
MNAEKGRGRREWKWEVVGGGVKLTTYLLVPKSRIVDLYLHFSILLRGLIFNKLSTV